MVNFFSPKSFYTSNGFNGIVTETCCAFCGAFADKPLLVKPTFTQYNLLLGTDYICDRCTEIYNDHKYRKNNWYQTPESNFNLIEKSDVLSTLTNLPFSKSTSFRIYLTIKKRMHGWINIINRWESDQNLFYVGYENSKILVDRDYLEDITSFVTSLRDDGITKVELRSGHINYGHIRSVSDYKNILIKLQSNNKNPLFNMVIDYVK